MEAASRSQQPFLAEPPAALMTGLRVANIFLVGWGFLCNLEILILACLYVHEHGRLSTSVLLPHTSFHKWIPSSRHSHSSTVILTAPALLKPTGWHAGCSLPSRKAASQQPA